MTEKPVLTRVIESTGGNILQITMNRPEVHNACNGEMAKYLLEAWLRFRDDDSLTVAVLHGAGDKSFCAGADLTALDTLAGGLLNSTSPDAAALERYAQNDPGPMGGSRIVQQKP
ncbi:MAG TPA: enoyl-CoA hydratase-related protein, partial [Turneriella sp.]|nr:enoyl-CoA hydratase-related protein [Turneriella sp.]